MATDWASLSTRSIQSRQILRDRKWTSGGPGSGSGGCVEEGKREGRGGRQEGEGRGRRRKGWEEERRETEAGVEPEGLSGLLQTHLASAVNLGPRVTPCHPGVVTPNPSS